MTKLKQLHAAQFVMDRQQKLAAKSLAQSQTALQAQEQQLQELLAYRQEYQQTLTQSSEAGPLRGQFIQQYQKFLERLDQGIHEQRQRVTQIQALCEKRRQDWMRSYHKVKAVENLQRRQAMQETLRQSRQEQKASDEQARRLNSKK